MLHKTKSAKINIRVTTTTHNNLTKIAQANRTTVSRLIRDYITSISESCADDTTRITDGSK